MSKVSEAELKTEGYAESDTCWHLLCRTHGGAISMLKNLDAPTARMTYRRLRPDSRPERHLKIPSGGVSWGCFGGSGPSDGAIKSVDIIGPEGCKLDPWRGVEPIYYDCSRRDHFGRGPLLLTPEEGRKLAELEDAAQRKGYPPNGQDAKRLDAEQG